MRDAFESALGRFASRGAVLSEGAGRPLLTRCTVITAPFSFTSSPRSKESDFESFATTTCRERRRWSKRGPPFPKPIIATPSAQVQAWKEAETIFGEADVVVCPATTGPAPDLSTTGDPVFNSPWSYTGLPTVNFPIGLSPEGLPLGIQLVGRRYDERRLFEAALWCEAIGER